MKNKLLVIFVMLSITFWTISIVPDESIVKANIIEEIGIDPQFIYN